jgi:hypothetical protein
MKDFAAKPCRIIPEDYPLINIQKTMERSTMFDGKTHNKWPFSIANYVSHYQRILLGFL